MSSRRLNFAVQFLAANPGGIMEIVPERRHDDELRAVIDQAIEFKKHLDRM
jgi:hypothetical protein